MMMRRPSSAQSRPGAPGRSADPPCWQVYPRDMTKRHGLVAVSHHTWMTGGGDPVRYDVRAPARP